MPQIIESSTADLHQPSVDSDDSDDSLDIEDVCNTEELWDHFSAIVAPEIVKYQVRESTSPPTLGRLLDMVCTRISKIEVLMSSIS